MRNIILITFISLVVFRQTLSQENEIMLLNTLLDDWHLAAAEQDQERYFGYLDEQCIYIGTDSSEIWTKQEFYTWSKPYFEQSNTWNFKANSRNIYVDEDMSTAWFDELIDYGPGTLRGSGVLIKRSSGWKILHYVLSVPVPNHQFKEVMAIINRGA